MAPFGRKKKNAAAAKPVQGDERPGQMQTLKDALALTRKEKPLALLLTTLVFVVVLVAGIILGSSLHHPVYFGVIFTPLALLVAFFFFTRQANSAAFASIEGQVGAGASVLMSIRRGFTVTPAVNVARNQDMVHRAVGRPGIVLVGEGTHAVRNLVIDEKKKMERFVPGIAITEIYVGNGDGQVSLKKLQKRLKKLPKKLSNGQVRELRTRLKAVGGLQMPIPKGPMPTRMPRAR